MNVFDNLAGALLENQLRALDRLPRGVADEAAGSWAARVERIVDPRQWFAAPMPAPLSALQRQVREAAPLWLLNAADPDRRAYAAGLSALLAAQGKLSSHDLFDDVFPSRASAERR
ncbi:hypothetical protein QNM99_20420 [Pseudomonas sp. PCH446]